MLRAPIRAAVAPVVVLTAVVVAVMGLTAMAGAATLPDDRRYELVSPADKNGGDVVPDSQRTRAAADGSAIGFVSLSGFGDALGSGVAVDYVSTRNAATGTSGWATHAITPLQGTLPVPAIFAGMEPLYVGEFSPDLSTGVFYSLTPLTGDPNVSGVANLYRRTDLKRAGAGSYDLLSLCPLCDATRTPLPPLPANSIIAAKMRPSLSWASPDFDHIVFESLLNLTSDAPAPLAGCDLSAVSNLCSPRAYEWDHGTLRLAQILPDGRVAEAAIIGQGSGSNHRNLRTPHTVSNGADGHRRIFFTQLTNGDGRSPSDPSLSDFERDRINTSSSGNVFMRVDHASTEQLNLSERSRNPVDVFGPATFLDASADGTRAFFLSPEALTDDATANGANKIYMYDATKPGTAPDNLTLLTPEVGDLSDSIGVVDVSDDGRYVYMVVIGQIIRGQPSLQGVPGMFLWHDGVTRYIGYGPVGRADGAEVLSVGGEYPRQTRVTPDGRHLLFSSITGNGLLGLDQGACESPFGRTCRQLYVYSADTGALVCASCHPRGVPPTTMAFSSVRENYGGTRTSWSANRAISADGSSVFFSTGEALVPEDTNGKTDAYKYDVATGTPHLISSGRSSYDSWFLDASRDGRDVFFETREQLVGWDVDGSYDIYDARVGGGLPDPEIPVICAGDSCQGRQAITPVDPFVATNTFRGAGNLVERLRPRKRALRCRRGFVKKRVRGKLKCQRRVTARARARAKAKAKRAHVQRRGS